MRLWRTQSRISIIVIHAKRDIAFSSFDIGDEEVELGNAIGVRVDALTDGVDKLPFEDLVAVHVGGLGSGDLRHDGDRAALCCYGEIPGSCVGWTSVIESRDPSIDAGWSRIVSHQALCKLQQINWISQKVWNTYKSNMYSVIERKLQRLSIIPISEHRIAICIFQRVQPANSFLHYQRLIQFPNHIKIASIGLMTILKSEKDP